jgi:hypothetical protein
MKKIILPMIFGAIFVLISGFQYYQHYLFRIQPPSEEWAKGIVISKGAVKNSPRIISFDGDYLVAHDDGENIKVIKIDKLGKKIEEKTIPGEDSYIKNINLITDGKYIYLNWMIFKNSVDNVINIKLDEKLNILGRWEIKDVGEAIQVGENAMVIAYNNKIDFVDYITQKSTSVVAKNPSKFAATKTSDGYLITYYQPNFFWGTLNSYGFWNFRVKNGIASKPSIVHLRTIDGRESVLGTALACDDKYAYLIIDRTVGKPGAPAQYGQSLLVKFPWDGSGEFIPRFDKFGDITNLDEIKSEEKILKILTKDEFTYNPIGVSSGNEARFLSGYTREYGKSERQFDIMDFSLKDGKTVKSTFIDKTREGTTMPWVSGDMVVYCNQTSSGKYDICITSSREDFKQANNGPRPSEVKLAILDIIMDLANSLFGLFTIGLRWIIPSLVLISLYSLFSYKMSIKVKRNIFLIISMVSSVLKLLSAKSIFYSGYITFPGILNSTRAGLLICMLLSILSYGYGYLKYNNAYNKNPGAMPIMYFTSAIIIDSILTQYIYAPFIM